MGIDRQAKANALTEQLIQWRRSIHANPELSFQEYDTANVVAVALQRMGMTRVETGVGKTGVVGTLTSGEGPTIAIRADMDALPILEKTDHDFRSKNEGIMHACGHDAHTAILLGAASLLVDEFQSGTLQGTVKFIFQPAEESTDENGVSGASYMIQDGVLNGVDAILALHMCPWLPVGKVQVNDGPSMASVDVFEGKLYGTGGHGAYPHLGTDPIWMLGPVLQALYGIVARKVSALDSAVISVGQINSGTASNIIPTEVTIEGTVRSYKQDVREFLVSELERVFALTRGLGGDYSFKIERGEPALHNDSVINKWLVQTICDLYPTFQIVEEPFGLGGEDFGWMTERVPGAMFFLGCAIRDGIKRDLHTPIFDIDEACLPVGTAILAETVRRYLAGEVSFDAGSNPTELRSCFLDCDKSEKII